jgi:hypothetical protein
MKSAVPLYVYAVLRARPRAALPCGLGRQPLRVVPAGGLYVIVGTAGSPPSPTPSALRAHDAVIRRLAVRNDAVLPVRFGTVVPDAAALAARLEPRAAALRGALALVAGREQMTLRVYGPAPAAAAGDDARARRDDSGARYLARRLAAWRRARSVNEVAPLRPALSGIVVAERVERHDRPPLLASLYHLVRRGEAARYRRAIARGRPALGAVRVEASGPWPPYAFVDEELA